MGNGDFTQSDYFPDGTLRRRTFSSRKVETVVTVNATGDTITKTRTRTQTAVRTYSGQFERTPDGLIYHTGAGYYDLSEKKHYSYLRDRMGSTAAVVDDDGKLVQTTGYYPSGTPYRLPSTAIGTPVDGKTDRLHIGNKWLGHSGLAMYDNTARLHDPLLMRYAAPDPLYAKFGSLSPWSHCASDPLNAIDPDGRMVLNSDSTLCTQYSKAGTLDKTIPVEYHIAVTNKFTPIAIAINKSEDSGYDYNCLGFSLLNAKAWINFDSSVRPILKDEYKKVKKVKDVRAGDVVTYEVTPTAEEKDDYDVKGKLMIAHMGVVVANENGVVTEESTFNNEKGTKTYTQDYVKDLFKDRGKIKINYFRKNSQDIILPKNQ